MSVSLSAGPRPDLLWQREKVMVDGLLRMWSTDGSGLLHALPAVLAFWVQQSAAGVATYSASSGLAPQNRLALQLLMHLAQLTGHSPGTDVVAVHALQDTFAGTGFGAAGGTVGEGDIVDCGTRLQRLKKVVDKAVREQWVHPGPTALSSSLESVDQVLVPAVFAGSVVLTAAHARRVADAIAAGDSITASKYHSLYALHDATRMVACVPVTLPPGFQVTHLEQRIRLMFAGHMDTLYAAACAMGAIGPSVFTPGASVKCALLGLRRPHGKSIALAFARAVDTARETAAGATLVARRDGEGEGDAGGDGGWGGGGDLDAE